MTASLSHDELMELAGSLTVAQRWIIEGPIRRSYGDIYATVGNMHSIKALNRRGILDDIRFTPLGLAVRDLLRTRAQGWWGMSAPDPTPAERAAELEALLDALVALRTRYDLNDAGDMIVAGEVLWNRDGPKAREAINALLAENARLRELPQRFLTMLDGALIGLRSDMSARVALNTLKQIYEDLIETDNARAALSPQEKTHG